MLTRIAYVGLARRRDIASTLEHTRCRPHLPRVGAAARGTFTFRFFVLRRHEFEGTDDGQPEDE